MISHFIVQTGPRPPGGVLYICHAESRGRRPKYSMEGYRDRAVQFSNRESAELAIMQFSTIYGLVIREITS